MNQIAIHRTPNETCCYMSLHTNNNKWQLSNTEILSAKQNKKLSATKKERKE